MSHYKRKKIGAILVERGSLTVEQLAIVVEQLGTTTQRFGTIAVSNGLLDDEELAQALAEQLDLADKNPIECMEFMREKMADTKDNKDFFKYMNA